MQACKRMAYLFNMNEKNNKKYKHIFIYVISNVLFSDLPPLDLLPEFRSRLIERVRLT